jgi:hypothetical protein
MHGHLLQGISIGKQNCVAFVTDILHTFIIFSHNEFLIFSVSWKLL